MIPILFSGTHGAAGKVITPEMVRNVWKRGQGRKVPIVAGHPEDNPNPDDEKAYGDASLERLVEGYVDESGVKREVAILGRVELNARGKKAVVDKDYLYYSPALKPDAGAGFIMRHVGLVNDPAQAGLPALQDLIVLSDRGYKLKGEEMPDKDGKLLFDEQQTKELQTIVQEGLTAGLAPVLEKLTALVEAVGGKTEPTKPADDTVTAEAAAELSDLRKEIGTLKGQVVVAQGEVTASRFLADAVGKGCPQKQAVILSDMVKADPRALPNAVKLADEAAAGAKLLGGITLSLTDEDKTKSKSDYEAGQKAAARVK